MVLAAPKGEVEEKMKLLKIVKRLMTCLAVASVAALAVGAAKAQDVTLRGASLFDNNHAYSKTLIKLGELVNASGQKVTFDLLGNRELGIEPDVVNVLKDVAINR